MLLKWPPKRTLWGPLALASAAKMLYNYTHTDHIAEPTMRFVRRQMAWLLVVLPLLTGCQPLEDLEKLIEDLLKRVT
jgi:hypothetical protein